MIIAVTGYKGRLGSWLVKRGCVPFKADITSPEEIKAAFNEIGPDVIINCAATTKVDACETDEDERARAIDVNMYGPLNLRRSFNGLLVQISTGFVLDGIHGPHEESAKPRPLSYYAWSKFGGETCSQIREPTLVVRALDLFGTQKKSDFVRQIRDLLELGADKELPSTLYGTPTYIPHLSEALLLAVSRELTGVLHLAGDLTLSRYEWGRAIAEFFDYDPELIKPTSEIMGVAPRPLRGGLDTTKARGLGLPILSPWDGLRALQDWEQARGAEE
ncbi:MAG: SDR family oxidoreductase [Candidatus Hodarchaeales archaeon]|jgi:dTDP-4-dehydrorhamnose reductase